eukprot:gene5843-11803_t
MDFADWKRKLSMAAMCFFVFLFIYFDNRSINLKLLSLEISATLLSSSSSRQPSTRLPSTVPVSSSLSRQPSTRSPSMVPVSSSSSSSRQPSTRSPSMVPVSSSSSRQPSIRSPSMVPASSSSSRQPSTRSPSMVPVSSSSSSLSSRQPSRRPSPLPSFSPSSSSSLETIIIACVGDSLTEGYAHVSYPMVLQSLLGNGYKVLNFGVAGSTMTKNVSRSYWSYERLSQAMTSSPDIVVIQFGTNDAKDTVWNQVRFLNDYSDMILRFQRLDSHPHVFICIPPPYMYRKSLYRIIINVINQVLPQIIPDLASSITNTSLIDNFNPMGGHNRTMHEAYYNFTRPHEYLNDGIHPNSLGYHIIAQDVFEAIASYVETVPSV